MPYGFDVYSVNQLDQLFCFSIWNYVLTNTFLFQGLEGIPDDIKSLYKTVWEISQKTVLKMAADRGAFIDQSQSLNVHIAEPNFAKLSSMHFYGWQSGLKTGMYYLRTKAAASAIQFTVDKTKLKKANETEVEEVEIDAKALAKKEYEEAVLICSRENKDDCLMCGS